MNLEINQDNIMKRAIYIGENREFGYGMTGDYDDENNRFYPDDHYCQSLVYLFNREDLYVPQQ